MRFGVLGPLEVWDGDVPVRVPTAKARVLLIGLLSRANRVVGLEELTDLLWDEALPAKPRAALQLNVRRLRQALGTAGAGLIQTLPYGYLIHVEPDQLDLLMFGHIIENAQKTDALVKRVELLEDALGLWRGEPFAGLAATRVTRDVASRLSEERLSAYEQLIDAQLGLGRHAQVVPMLTSLTAENPGRERFWGQLMLALYRSERQSDALQAYRVLYQYLDEELGVVPGEAIRRLHEDILRSEPGLVEAAPMDMVAPSWSIHCQLPLDVADFTGRDNLIRDLEVALSNESSMSVVVLSGQPGVGKSALAVRVAHRLRAHFPDGQWYLRLDGSRAPREAADVLMELLRMCGVVGSAVPPDVDGRAARLRSLLADRRVLLLLDDAAHVEQVEPLLPGTAGSAVLVTSRYNLRGLAVRSAAQRIVVDVLQPEEARALLARTLSVEAEESADDLAQACGHLPIALRIAAANLGDASARAMREYAATLRSDASLSKFSIRGDGAAAVRVVFDQAFTNLRREAQRLFNLLGLVPGPEFTVKVAAALLGSSAEAAGTLVEQLADANLIQLHTGGRYTFHDLLRRYAAERAAADPERDAAWERLCRWYVATVDAAALLVAKPGMRLPRPYPSETFFSSKDEAAQWLDAERENVAAVAVRASHIGPVDAAWHLADALREYLNRNICLRQWRVMAEAGLRAASVAGDTLTQAAMLHLSSSLRRILGNTEVALEQAQQGLERYREAGHSLGEVSMLINLANIHVDVGNVRGGADLLEEALALLSVLDLPKTRCVALLNSSRAQLYVGGLRQAIAAADECLSIDGYPYLHEAILSNRGGALRLAGDYREAEAVLLRGARLHDLRHRATCHVELSLTYSATGQLGTALHHATAGAAGARSLGLTRIEAEALNALGVIHLAQKSAEVAERCFREAEEIARTHGYRTEVDNSKLGLAELANLRHSFDESRDLAQDALNSSRSVGHRINECRALMRLATACRKLGRDDDAAFYAAEAERIREETGFSPPPRGDASR